MKLHLSVTKLLLASALLLAPLAVMAEEAKPAAPAQATMSADTKDAPAAATAATPAAAPAAAPADAKPKNVDPVLNTGDTAWMLVSSALVLMMTGPGLALFYSGLVRRKNVLATMMQSFILMAVVSIVWAVIGYSLAFDVAISGFQSNCFR